MKELKTLQFEGRHGDLVIRDLGDAQPPVKLVESPTELAIAGSTPGTKHTFPKGTLHGVDGRRHYVQLLEPTPISHGSTHKQRMLSPGLKEIYPQIERRGDGDVDVDD